MKIQCPACKTSYQVNLPNIGPKGVAVECAKCHNKFVVKPEGRPLQEAPRPEKVAVGAPTIPEKAPASDFKSESPPAPQSLGAEETPEPSFDDFLDQLIEKKSIKEPVAPPPPAKKVPESKPAKPQQTDNLDNLLDDLMSSDLSFETPETVSEATGGDETKPAPQETALEQDSGSGPTEMPETSHKEPEIDFSGIQGLDDVAMDNIWDQAVAEGAKEEESKEETPSPPAPARKEVPDQATASKQAKKAPSAPAQTAPPAETGEADLWAQAFAEQDGLNKNIQGEGAGEPAGAAAPAAPPAETNEEDLWAQAFAEQDGLNKNIQGEGAGEPAGAAAPAAPPAETNEEDLWAQAF
ncbi:MAG: zinc-ribbon domain-containing protein, partial [Nitrospinae bacterium]|nr:zinc-ribbon domain-containing protein [Nitrospinota bacterium]